MFPTFSKRNRILTKLQMPLAGAYAIENMVNELAEACVERISAKYPVMKPDFSSIRFNQFEPPSTEAKKNLSWTSPEKIEIKNFYTLRGQFTSTIRSLLQGYRPIYAVPTLRCIPYAHGRYDSMRVFQQQQNRMLFTDET